MKHEENLWLSAYLDGELSATERKHLDVHLPRCVECRVELESLRMVKREMAGLERRAAPPEFIAGLEERFAPRVLERHAFFSRQVYWAMAAGLLAFGLWLTARYRAQERFVPLEPLIASHARYRARAPLTHYKNLIASADSFQTTADYGSSADER